MKNIAPAQEGEGDLARRGRDACKKAPPCLILGSGLSPADCVVNQVRHLCRHVCCHPVRHRCRRDQHWGGLQVSTAQGLHLEGIQTYIRLWFTHSRPIYTPPYITDVG